MTDWAAPFELRKLQWRLSRAPSGGIAEDVDVMTFHFAKAAAGVMGTFNDATDLAAVETALGTYVNTLKTGWKSYVHSDQYRWYRDGPAFYVLNEAGTAYTPIGGNAAIRVTEVDVPGTSATTAQLAPQLAMTITEVCSSRLHWGRYYLPAGTVDMSDADGRIASSTIGTILPASITFYNACRAAQMVPVVFSIQKPVRPRKPSGTWPAVGAVAYEVLSLQMDNLFDVIRSRRYRGPTTRTRTALT